MTSRKSAAIETKSGASTLLQDLKVGWGVCRGGRRGVGYEGYASVSRIY